MVRDFRAGGCQERQKPVEQWEAMAGSEANSSQDVWVWMREQD